MHYKVDTIQLLCDVYTLYTHISHAVQSTRLLVPVWLSSIVNTCSPTVVLMCNVIIADPFPTEQAKREEERRKEELRAKLNITQVPEVILRCSVSYYFRVDCMTLLST